MNVGKILSAAWEIARRQRSLWLFGYLAALVGAPTEATYPRGWALLMKTLSRANPGSRPPRFVQGGGWQPLDFWRGVLQAMPEHTAKAVGNAHTVSMLGVLLLFYALFALGAGGVLFGAAQHLRGETPTRQHLWGAARRFFWRLFFFPVPVVLIFVIALAGLGMCLVGVAMQAGAVVAGLALILFGIVMVVSWLVGVYVQLGETAVVVDDLSLWGALGRAETLWRKHFWRAALVALVLWLIQKIAWQVVGFVISWGVAFLGVLLQFGGQTLVGWFAAHPALTVVTSIGLAVGSKALAALPLAPVVTFTLAGWVLLYRALSGFEPQPTEISVPAQEA